MEATNITIKIDSGLAREAKVLAARRGTSLSRLVADQLQLLVQEEQAYAAARRRAVHKLKAGFDMGWEEPENRDELHERETLR